MAESSPNLSFPITLQHEHRLIFTRDVFAPENLTLAQTLTPREPGENVRALVGDTVSGVCRENHALVCRAG